MLEEKYFEKFKSPTEGNSVFTKRGGRHCNRSRRQKLYARNRFQILFYREKPDEQIKLKKFLPDRRTTITRLRCRIRTDCRARHDRKYHTQWTTITDFHCTPVDFRVLHRWPRERGTTF